VNSADDKPYQLESHGDAVVLRLVSADGTNRLTRARVRALTAALEKLAKSPPSRLVLTGNAHFFSAWDFAGAELGAVDVAEGARGWRHTAPIVPVIASLLDSPAARMHRQERHRH